MIRWRHPHSVAAGLAGGMIAGGHPWWTVPFAFAAGIAVGRFWLTIRRAAIVAAHKAYELHDAKVATETARGDNIRAQAATAARRLRNAVELAYRQGAEDVLKEQASR